MSGDSDIPGFSVPVHRALTTPILLAGAPRGPAIALGTIAAALGIGLQQFVAGLLLWAVGHALLVQLARHDPDMGAVLARHLKHKGFLAC